MTIQFCLGHKEHHCHMGLVLRPSLRGTDLGCYMIGTIEPDFMAALIHHNNLFHGGNTYEQIGKLCRIMKERETQQDWKYNVKEITNDIETKVDLLTFHHQQQILQPVEFKKPHNKKRRNKTKDDSKKKTNSSPPTGSDLE